MEQHPRLGVPADGAGEDPRLDVAPGGDERVRREAVVDPRDVLLDDRPLAELG
ncbi:hypothetical protein [Janibacter melonis]|uniref:hypothetical protein n=1 Tax=Janibacter melonis TaxID=262209 RepID=UPI003558E31A